MLSPFSSSLSSHPSALYLPLPSLLPFYPKSNLSLSPLPPPLSLRNSCHRHPYVPPPYSHARFRSLLFCIAVVYLQRHPPSPYQPPRPGVLFGKIIRWRFSSSFSYPTNSFPLRNGSFANLVPSFFPTISEFCSVRSVLFVSLASSFLLFETNSYSVGAMVITLVCEASRRPRRLKEPPFWEETWPMAMLLDPEDRRPFPSQKIEDNPRPNVALWILKGQCPRYLANKDFPSGKSERWKPWLSC